jgi:uncharacterized delta-60 repeat protein
MGIGSFISPIISGGGGGEGNFDIDTNVLNRFTRLTDTGDFDAKLVNQVFKNGLVTDVTGSLVTTKDGFSGTTNKIKIDANGKIYVVGSGISSYNGVGIIPFSSSSDAFNIIRLNANLSVDTAFDYGVGFTGFIVNTIQIDANNKIYVGGGFTSYNGVVANRIIRLNPDGTIDTDFNIGSGFSSSVLTIEIDSNGKIYLGGFFTSYNGVGANRIIRLNPDGSIDTDFDYGTGFPGTVNTIKIDANGKVYVGGFFTSYNGVGANRIIRLNPDGSIDTDFDYGTGFPSIVNDIKIDSNGKVYVGGSFTSYNGVGADRIIRLNPDGTIDTDFNIGSGFNNGVNTIKIDSNDKIYVGGFYTSYNGVGANRIIRLNSNGTVDTPFDYGTGFNQTVNTIEIDSNGKVYVGGGFISYNGL